MKNFSETIMIGAAIGTFVAVSIIGFVKINAHLERIEHFARDLAILKVELEALSRAHGTIGATDPRR